MEPSTCERVREALLDGDLSSMRDLTAHLEHCADCKLAAHAWPLAARALREAERVSAPTELDSAVVAALHAGVRGDRAVRALRQLARLAPPAELDEAVDPSPAERASVAPAAPESVPESDTSLGAEELGFAGFTPAPRVLDRLVHEELLDPSKALVRRHVGGLTRLRAPAELAARVAAACANPDSRMFVSELRGAPAPSRRSAVREAVRELAARRVRSVFAAAALFAMLALPLVFLSREPDVRQRPFRVERADSLSALSPISRSLLNQASSGMLDPDRP